TKIIGSKNHLDYMEDIQPNSKIIGSLGRLVFVKGYDILIDAAKIILQQLPDVQFIIMGEGIEYEALIKKAEKAGVIDNFLFPGFVKNRLDYIYHFDLFVLPSRYEGVPVAILEAMAAKVPIIATNVGGIPYIIQNQSTGFLVEPENSLAIAKACLYLFNNEKFAKNLANRAYMYVSNEFSAEKLRSKINNLYHELIFNKVRFKV
ncbi:MAG: glycosyltransferase family 4 protein, partial [Candidatus Hodarchaeota archaeon]